MPKGALSIFLPENREVFFEVVVSSKKLPKHLRSAAYVFSSVVGEKINNGTKELFTTNRYP
jgi:hypothetical protein